MGTAKRLSPQVLTKLAEFLAKWWPRLHIEGREDIAGSSRRPRVSEVRDRVLEILGGGLMEVCWRAKATLGKRSVRNDEASISLLKSILRDLPHGQVCSMCAFTAHMLVHMMSRLDELTAECPANVPERRAALQSGYKLLGEALRALLDTGAFSDFPNTSGTHEIDPEQLTKLAKVLIERYRVIRNAAHSTRLPKPATTALAQASGGVLFAGILKSRDESPRPRIEDPVLFTAGATIPTRQVEALVAWLGRGAPRARRGFYSEIAAGIQQLWGIQKQLVELRAKEKQGTARYRDFSNCIKILTITIKEVLDTGVFVLVPV